MLENGREKAGSVNSCPDPGEIETRGMEKKAIVGDVGERYCMSPAPGKTACPMQLQFLGQALSYPAHP